MVNVTANLLGVATLEPCFDSLEMDVETGPVAKLLVGYETNLSTVCRSNVMIYIYDYMWYNI